MKDSRISGLYKVSIAERVATLAEHGWLSATDATELLSGRHVLTPAKADSMIENVIGVFGLPLGIAPNFRVNGVDRLVPPGAIHRNPRRSRPVRATPHRLALRDLRHRSSRYPMINTSVVA